MQFLKAVSENCGLPHISVTSSSIFLLYVHFFFIISQAISFFCLLLLSFIKSKIPIVFLFFSTLLCLISFPYLIHCLYFPSSTVCYIFSCRSHGLKKLVNYLSLLISLSGRAVLISKGNAMWMVGHSVSASHGTFGAKNALVTLKLSEGAFPWNNS